ncbi:MAG TPA: hypothetical protein VKR56_02340 [Candidatus Cybelea sp.]|nr:hypothetical protein [Candidatus Cybelea sp.]
MLEKEIEAFNAQRVDLESLYDGKWVVFHDAAFFGAYDSFDVAAEAAVQKFGRGPYLIRQVGAPDMILPASIMYRIAS